jgi:hypothetical protein
LTAAYDPKTLQLRATSRAALAVDAVTLVRIAESKLAAHDEDVLYQPIQLT